jgi:P27 family predicted phage terminase small subunit
MGLRGPLRKTVPINSLPVPAEELQRPEMPAHVKADPVAAECFGNVCNHLEAVGLLRSSHAMALGILASEYSRYIVATEKSRLEPIVTGGSGGPKANPASGVAATAAKQCIDILKDFGMTLASMGRTEISRDNAVPSKLQEFIASRNRPA